MNDTSPTSAIAARLDAVRSRLDRAAADAGRAASAITLIAVSKRFGADSIAAALAAGQRDFGENRIQEALAKWPALKEKAPAARLHLIGGLQTNKAAQAVALFDVIHSLDRPRLARTLAREMAAQGRRPDCYIQINSGAEAQKSGVLPTEAEAFIALCTDELKLPVVGLMCIPPHDEEAALHFALLAKIAARHGLAGLSMGMSGDFETAIALGATCVRVGTAIFGPRPE